MGAQYGASTDADLPQPVGPRALRFANVRIIVNPASGRDRAILGPLNDVLHPAAVHWDVRITNGPTDATELARQAVIDGVDAVGVYGGNGTVAAVAEGLQGSEVPLWVLPGGTGNGTAAELGLPRTLKRAAEVLLDPATRVESVDLGRLGEKVFVLRAGVGAIAEVDRRASREMKDRVAGIAYAMAGLSVLRSAVPIPYRVTVDGAIFEQDAVACIVANGAAFGGVGVLSDGVSMTDGRLDVFLYHGDELADPAIAFSRAPEPGEKLSLGVPPVASGRRIRIETATPQPAVVDGEDAGLTPVDIEVMPERLNVLVL